MFDLGIEGGTVVSPSGRRRGHVYVSDGRVAAVTAEPAEARERVDATGLLVLPGMVDAHVHFMDPGDPEREDFPTGSSAAAAAGVTTVVEHTHASPVVNGDDLRQKVGYLSGRSRVDFGLAAHALPERIAEARDAWASGATYLKAFTCTTHGIPGFDSAHLRALLADAAELHAVCLVHCEDEALTAFAEHELREAGREDNAIVTEWRNRDAELTALSMTMLLAQRTGARVIAAHVSSAEGLAVVDHYRSLGARVQAESCPQYLSLREDEVIEHGAFRKFTPPARARSGRDLEAMWAALAAGTIDFISTDHAPATREHKTDGSIWDVHFGLPGVDTTLPILLDGAARGLIGYEKVVEAYAETPAKTYGLYPRKGTLAPGADADVALVDPDREWTIRDEDVLSRAGWSPFSGRTVKGRVVQTYLRGRLVAEDRKLVGELEGAFLPGPGLAVNR